MGGKGSPREALLGSAYQHHCLYSVIITSCLSPGPWGRGHLPEVPVSPLSLGPTCFLGVWLDYQLISLQGLRSHLSRGFRMDKWGWGTGDQRALEVSEAGRSWATPEAGLYPSTLEPPPIGPETVFSDLACSPIHAHI